MAESEQRFLDWRIRAFDEASSVFARYASNVKRTTDEVQKTTSKITGPTTINRQMTVGGRTQDDQYIRDAKAERIKQLRADTQAAAKERAKFIADEQLFGRQLAEEMRKGGQTVAKESSGILHTIKSSFGRGSTFKEVVELFHGAGVIAGLTLATRGIADMAKGMREAVTQFRAGEITAGQMADKLAGSIPILGNIWRAGRDIREVFTGDEAALAAVKLRADALASAFEVVRSNIRGMAKDERSLSLELRSMERDTARIGLTGFAADLASVNDLLAQSKDAIESAKAEAEDFSIDPNNEISKKIAELTKLRNAIVIPVEVESGPLSDPQFTVSGNVDERNALLKQKADLDAQILELTSQREAKKSQIIAGGEKKAVEIEARAAKTREDIQKRFNLRMADLEYAGGQRLIEDQQEYQKALLEGAGASHESRLLELRSAHAKRLEEIRRASEEERKSMGETGINPLAAMSGPVGERFQPQVDSENAKFKALTFEENRQFQKQLEDDQRSHESRMASIESQSRQDQLHRMGLDFQAQQEARREAFASQVRELDEQMRQLKQRESFISPDVFDVESKRIQREIEALRSLLRQQEVSAGWEGVANILKDRPVIGPRPEPNLVESRFQAGGAGAERSIQYASETAANTAEQVKQTRLLQTAMANLVDTITNFQFPSF